MIGSYMICTFEKRLAEQLQSGGSHVCIYTLTYVNYCILSDKAKLLITLVL